MPDQKRFIGIGNYILMVRDPAFWNALLNTIYQVSVTVFVQLIFGMIMALLLTRNVKGMQVLRSLYMLPMMTTPIIVGLIWRMLYNPELGMINYFLSLIGIRGPNWLGDSVLAMPSVILTDIWVATPFVTIILVAGIQSLPKEPFEAARIDGASHIQIFKYITLPLLRPIIWIAFLFRTMDCIKRFDSIYIMTSGGPGTATETLNLYAYNNAFNYMHIGSTAALATFMLVTVFVLSLYVVNRIRRNSNSY
jgi:multiple sugar transport system permease protein